MAEGKAPKGAPKLRRCSRMRGKYAAQFDRTFRNKLRRVRKHNGLEAARDYELAHAPWLRARPAAEAPLVKPRR